MYGYRDEREWYDLQQVCLAGHVITNYAQSKPESQRPRCAECGESTITQCPSCNARLKGYHHVPGVFYVGSRTPNKFCEECGAAMPWIAREIDAVVEIASMSDALTETDHERLREDLKALVTPSSQVEIAALRIRKLAARMDEYEAAALMRALKAAATDAAKIALGLVDDTSTSKRRR